MGAVNWVYLERSFGACWYWILSTLTQMNSEMEQCFSRVVHAEATVSERQESTEPWT